MPQSYYVALFNLGRNSSRLTPIIVSPLSMGALRGELRGREGFLFRSGLFGFLLFTK